jgi:hypothetical protein
MVYKVNHEQLNEIIKQYYDKKLSLFCFGAFGIGKSFVVRDTAKEIATSRGREFVEWNKLDKKKKQEVYEYPEKYFVLIDERLSEYDSSDIKGLPNFKEDKEVLEWKVPFWAKLIAKEGGDGIVFFDEINLATPLVISSVYKIIYDRIVGEEKVGKNWFIMGAGNREEDRAFTHSLPAPVKDRGGEVELIAPTTEDWTIWATQNNIDSRILGFVNFKPTTLYKVDFDDGQKFTTTRGWERLSKLIKDTEVNDIFEMMACSAIGEGVAREFISFCRLKDKFKLEEILKNPKKLKDIEDISIKYLLTSSLAEKYMKKEKGMDFNKVMEVSKVLDEIGNAEFVALLWKLCSSYTKETKLFHNDFLSSKDTELINKYGKYILR